MSSSLPIRQASKKRTNYNRFIIKVSTPWSNSWGIFNFNHMRLLLILFSVILFPEIPDPVKEPDYSLTVKPDKYIKTGDALNASLKVVLANNTNDTLRYLSMSCSWQRFYTTDNDKVKVVSAPCDKNIPHELKLAPHHKRTVFLEVQLENQKDPKEKELVIRVAQNIIKLNSPKELIYFKKLQKEKNYIWSKQFTLKPPLK